MYNPPATASHIRMTLKVETKSALVRAADWTWRHPWIVGAVFALLLAIQITPQFKMSPDGVSYLSIARNLILRGKLERLGSPHLGYAPGYPVFISPAFLFGSTSFIAVQVIQWIYALILMLGVYVWFARYAGRSAIWIAALTMASAGYWDLFRTASSEIVFAPCLVWAAVFMAKSIDSPNSIPAIIGAIILGSLACATRQAGAMLVPGYLLAAGICMFRGRIPPKKGVVLGLAFTISIFAVSGALIVFDHWGMRQVPGDTGYTAIFFHACQSLGGQLAEGTRRQIAEIGRLLLPGMWKTHSREHDFLDINNWIFAAVCIPIAIGWWRFCRETIDPFAISLPFFIALYIMYPYDSGTRFTVPVIPILAGSIWYLLKTLGDKRATIFLSLIAAHTVLSIGFWVVDAVRVRQRYQRWPEIQRVAAAIPPSAKIIALRVDASHGDIDDRWMFLMCLTDRQVVPETLTNPAPSTVDWIVTIPAEAIQPGFEPVGRVDDYQIEKRMSLK
jgi:hypothetical protein